MNTDSILEWLAAVGVPTEVVSIGAEADNAWCVLRDDQPGDQGEPGWEVFWREQGNRYDWARFSSESVACHYLFGRLTWAQVARGAVGLLPEHADGGQPAQQAPVQQPPAQAAPAQPVPAHAASVHPAHAEPVRSAESAAADAFSEAVTPPTGFPQVVPPAS